MRGSFVSSTGQTSASNVGCNGDEGVKTDRTVPPLNVGCFCKCYLICLRENISRVERASFCLSLSLDGKISPGAEQKNMLARTSRQGTDQKRGLSTS